MRTATILDHLALARDHVARIIGILEQGGSRLVMSRARALLAEFESIQAIHIADRDRLERELAEKVR